MKFFKLTDVILIVVLLATGFFAHRSLSRGENLIAEITVDNEIYQKIDLNTVENAYFLEINSLLIEIDHGKLRFCSSDCHDKTCVNSGWLSHAGDFAACLPNRVAIKILSSSAPDAITG